MFVLIAGVSIYGRGSGWARPHRDWRFAAIARSAIALMHRIPQSSLPAPEDTVAHASAATVDGNIFDHFVREHEARIFGYLWRMTGDREAAYDLSQETFLRAWRHFSKVAGYERPEAWLFRVATHLAMNYRRDERPESVVVSIGAREDESFARSDPALHVVERDAVEQVLLLIPRRHRAALILREVYGWTPDEIARLLNVSRAAAKMALSRAREQFRQQYLREEAE